MLIILCIRSFAIKLYKYLEVSFQLILIYDKTDIIQNISIKILHARKAAYIFNEFNVKKHQLKRSNMNHQILYNNDVKQ